MSESAASERGPDPTSERPGHRPEGAPEPDVLLDIPEVTVDELRLAVDGLDADLSLRARLANLVQLDAGVRVHLEGVELDVTGVSAEALLKVRLEKLVQILDRALTTIDRNPQVIEALARSAGVSLDDVNREARKLAGVGEPVVDQRGEQVGTVGAVADRALRGDTAEPASAQLTGARPPEPPTGNAERTAPGAGGGPTPAGETVGGAAVGGPAVAGPRSGGSVGGPPGGPSGGGPSGGGPSGGPSGGGAGKPAADGAGSEGAGAGKPAAGGAGGESEAGGGGAGQPPAGGAGGGKDRPEAGSGGAKPGSEGAGGGRPPTGAGQAPGAQQPSEGGRPSGPSAAQLAGQAGETLRQAGRSVWEAIQGGMGQNRQQRPKR
ncbi:hypothetical protein ACIBPB_24575 [Micromonospora sp. NPDC049836]|uniref:hypothetical protein n=1 Tax=Micromonospora sp. NPDC049836 TaxID=3364274 RepID=UPI0037932737